MSHFKKMLGILVLLCMATTASAKVRVLFLKIVYTGGYLHSSIAGGTPSFQTMLKSPLTLTGTASLTNSTLGTGDTVFVPEGGFQIDTIGQGNAAGFTTEQITRFMTMLDSVDVLVMANSLGFGGTLGPSSAANRTKFLNFARTKGIVGFHSTNDNHSSSSTAPTWTQYDSLCGSLFVNHATSYVTMKKDSLAFNTGDADFAYLNKGLNPSYKFYEELYSVSPNPRSVTGMHILYTLDEKTFTANPVMGDHPYSYYRNSFSGFGGRFWYSSEGHTDSLYQKNYSFRRQFYNAVLWAAHQDTATGGPSAITTGPTREFKSGVFMTSIAGSSLKVSPLLEGNFRVEIRGLDGKRVAFENGQGKQPVTFELHRNAVYAITTQIGRNRQSSLVTMP